LVIACERCSTRFHLDEGRIPAGGARVRCSRCKHAFFVAGPGASSDDAVHAVAADAAAHAARAPEATEDPPEAPAVRVSGRTPSAREDEESDWQFNLDPAPERGEEPRIRTRARPEQPTEPRVAVPPRRAVRQPEPEIGVEALESFPESAPLGERFAEESEDESGPSLEDLGSPESWSFFSEEEGSRHEAVAEPAPHPARSEPAVAAVPAQPRGEAAPRTRRPTLPEQRLPGLARRGAWLLLAALGLLGLYGALRAGRPLPAPPAALLAVGGLSAEGLRGRIIENAATGPVLLVSGAFVNRGQGPLAPGPSLRVRLVDRRGRALDVPAAAAGSAVSEASLREEAPAVLHPRLDRAAVELAHRTLAPGERVDFQALFEKVPPDAAGFVLAAD
jgi:predicted Zn finger-like uncharacterized protein